MLIYAQNYLASWSLNLWGKGHLIFSPFCSALMYICKMVLWFLNCIVNYLLSPVFTSV